jgi:hypothetical protein
MPQMLDLLNDPSPEVRGTANMSVCRLIEASIDYDAAAPPEKRAAAEKKLRESWEKFKTRTLKSWQKRLEEKDAHPIDLKGGLS